MTSITQQTLFNIHTLCLPICLHDFATVHEYIPLVRLIPLVDFVVWITVELIITDCYYTLWSTICRCVLSFCNDLFIFLYFDRNYDTAIQLVFFEETCVLLFVQVLEKLKYFICLVILI